jgi:DNA-binding transcriptional ArsR family regulator
MQEPNVRRRVKERDADPAADELEGVWRALSSPVRRSILDALMEGPRTTGSLDERFPELSRFAIMQHLKVLEAADLVIAVRDGRHRYNYLNPVPIQRIYDRWVSRYMKPWTDALTSLKHELEAARDRTA